MLQVGETRIEEEEEEEEEEDDDDDDDYSDKCLERLEKITVRTVGVRPRSFTVIQRLEVR
jgi:hypothetical protein